MLHIVLGTRAQLIKMLPILMALKERGAAYNFVFLAQHKMTVGEMLSEYGLREPDVVLGDTGSDIVTTGSMLRWSIMVLWRGWRHRKTIFRGDRHGIVLVHGDAPPMFLGATLARLSGLKVAHVEAGLRSYHLLNPFPEELTRVAAGRLGLIDLHFCQDEHALQNAEAYPGTKTLVGGNTIVDSLKLAAPSVASVEPPYGLVSLHRYELLRDRQMLQWVVRKLCDIARISELRFVLHPPTETVLRHSGLMKDLEAVSMIKLYPRMTYSKFQALLGSARFMISDGGSNQEESAYLGVPCLLFRNFTERREGLGRNVVLSRFDEAVIDEFVAAPDRYRVITEPGSDSPTEIILRELAEYL